jgi:hypothetical protein
MYNKRSILYIFFKMGTDVSMNHYELYKVHSTQATKGKILVIKATCRNNIMGIDVIQYIA